MASLQVMADVESSPVEASTKERARVIHLSDLAVRIALASSLEDVLQTSVSGAKALIDADFGVIHFVDRVVGSIDATYHDGYPMENIPEAVVPMGSGVLGRIMRGSVVFTEDVTGEVDFAGFPPWHPEVKSMIGVPVRHGEAVHAIMILGRDSKKPPFEDEDLFFISAVASLAGVALHVSNQRGVLDEARCDAEAMGRARGEFLIELSRELREHVNTIMGMSEVLMSTELSPDQRGYVASISRNSDAILGHLENTLESQKVHSASLEMETIDFDLQGALSDSLALARSRTSGRDIEVESIIQAGFSTRLRGDPGRLRQVLSALLDNAVKYTEKGRVVLSVCLGQEDEQGVTLRFEITDTGFGIPPDRVQRIIDGTSSNADSIVKILSQPVPSLQIARKLVEMMGGRMTVASELGKGSTFSFTAKFSKSRKDETVSLALADAVLGLHVLVAQDEKDDRTILANILADMGARVVTAASGSEAIEKLISAHRAERRFDMVMLDAHMSGNSGFATTRILRSLPEGRNVPVILLSPSGRRGESIISRDAGCNGYLTKPVRRAELYDAIMLVLGTQAVGSGDLVTRHCIRESGGIQARVLLVGRESLNLMSASRILEGRGHVTEIVGDLEAATQKLTEDGGYDLALVNLPVAEGALLEATVALRHTDLTYAHLPVLAVTRRDDMESRSSCRDAGFCDYVSSPIDATELLATVERWARKAYSEDGDDHARGGGRIGAEIVLDTESLLERLSGDRKLYEDLVSVATTEIPPRMDEVRSMIRSGDGPGVRLALRRLEEIASAVGASQMIGVTREIELAIEGGSRDGSSIRRLEMAWDRLRPRLEKRQGRD